MNELLFLQKIMAYMKRVPLTGDEVLEWASTWNMLDARVQELMLKITDAKEVKKDG